MNCYCRNLTIDDLPQMEYLESVAWPEDVRAPIDKLQDRLQTFPKGVLGAFTGGHLVGMGSCQIIHYQSNDRPIPWTTLTADGWISSTHAIDGNCLHFVSHCVHPEVRHRGIGTMLNRARLTLGREMGLCLALTDTRLPGLHRYLNEHPLTTADRYVAQVISGHLSEPVVRMYLKLGFKAVGLVPDCMRSDAQSANYGLALIKDLKPDVRVGR